uniref:Metalloendopeptidase n=1 Tax=Leptobrachium leishanense TaxID=445787 RepID=A0A8C5QG87_9ANUR
MGLFIILLVCVIGQVMNGPLPPSIQIKFPGLTKLAGGEETWSPNLRGAPSSITNINPDSDIPMMEGDILIHPRGRSAINCVSCLWPKSADGTVLIPYNLSSGYSQQQVSLFQNSLQEFHTLTCIRFVPRTTEKDFISILSTGGICASFIGRIGGEQQVYLDSGSCMSRGTIQHELEHNVGFFHEQSRSDRDDFVTIMTQFISPDKIGNFDKMDTNNVGLEYDYGSVMHYPGNAFSNTSGQATIVPKPNPSIPIGQRIGLSPLDVSKINRLYQCDDSGLLLNSANGTVTSANYPSTYPNNSTSVWLIRTPSGQVSLQFIAFDVQFSTDCVSDYIKIFDGPSEASPVLLDRTCGMGLIPQLISSTSQMLIEFVSDTSITATGFKATYTAVQCGGAFYAPGKNFTSPGYPAAYSPNMNCIWKITAPAGYKISLTLHDFMMESAPNCKYDSLSIYDGADTSSVLMVKYCGTKSARTFNSTGNAQITVYILSCVRAPNSLFISFIKGF